MAESHADDGRIEISVPARPDSLELVHEVLQQLWLGHDGVEARDRLRFETAVVEIFANIVEHAFRADADSPDVDGRRLDLMLVVHEDEVVAAFTDNGRPAELDLSAVTLPDEEAESGRGLAMAIAVLDDLHYQREGGRNHWRLTCRFGGA